MKCVGQALVIYIAFGLINASAGEGWPRHTFQKILTKSRLPKQSFSLIIGEVRGGKSSTFYEYNSTSSRIPASVTKIVTGAVALDSLPQGYKAPTRLRAKNRGANGVLNGPLYFEGGGDSGFVSENLWFLVNEFVRAGITTIDGNIVVDDTRFDAVRFDQGRDPQRVNRAYDAPIGALSFNWNSVNVFVRPGNSVGSKAKVFADPINQFTVVKNTVKTTRGSRSRLKVVRKESSNKNHLTVSGTIGVSSEEVVKYSSITQPDLWSGYQLKSFLQQRGIRVTGNVMRGKAPVSTVILAEYEGKSVGDSVKDMLKFSNNFVAEMLTKNIGAQLNGSPGTMQNGLKVINSRLEKYGFKKDEFHISSPSGLSRKNRFRAKDIYDLLNYMRSNFRVYPEFVAALPISGIDGTLKNRMTSNSVLGRVRAKTGLLSGVAGLAGYASHKSGKDLTFVFLYNGKSGTELKARDTFDQLLEVLLR